MDMRICGTGRNVVELAAGRGGVAARLRRSDAAVAAVVDLVAASEQVPPAKLLDPERGDSHVAAARHLAMYLAHVMLSRPLPRIGQLFDRDRTSVSHACALIEDRRDDPAFDSHVCGLEAAIAGWDIVTAPDAEVNRAAG